MRAATSLLANITVMRMLQVCHHEMKILCRKQITTSEKRNTWISKNGNYYMKKLAPSKGRLISPYIYRPQQFGEILKETTYLLLLS